MNIWQILKSAVSGYLAHGALSRGAAISFYSVTSLAPVLLIVIAIAGLAFGQDAVRGSLVHELSGALGKDSADLIQSLIAKSSDPSSGAAATVFGLVMVLITASGMGATSAHAATVSQELSNVQIRDAENKPTWITDFGKKLVALFYNDADEADMNDPLADAIKAKNFAESRYKGIGIGNLKDSKAPNFLIRQIIQGKIEKYQTTILTDPDLTLARAWDLGDCNNTSVFILI